MGARRAPGGCVRLRYGTGAVGARPAAGTTGAAARGAGRPPLPRRVVRQPAPPCGRRRGGCRPAGRSVRAGDQLIADVYNRLRAHQDIWSRCALIVTYDEHGGFFDHVAPPAAVNPDGIDSPRPDDNFGNHAPPVFAFDRLGPRVPTLVASPWVGKGVVVHTQLQHTSVLRTVRERFGIAQSHSAPARKRSRRSHRSSTRRPRGLMRRTRCRSRRSRRSRRRITTRTRATNGPIRRCRSCWPGRSGQPARAIPRTTWRHPASRRPRCASPRSPSGAGVGTASGSCNEIDASHRRPWGRH